MPLYFVTTCNQKDCVLNSEQLLYSTITNMTPVLWAADRQLRSQLQNTLLCVLPHASVSTLSYSKKKAKNTKDKENNNTKKLQYLT